MGWLEFFASLLGDLAWPVLLLAIALVYKGPIVKLLGRLRHGKWGDREVEFAEALERAEGHVEGLPTEVDEQVQGIGVVGQPPSEDADESGPSITAGQRLRLAQDEFAFLGLARDADWRPSYSITAAWERTREAVRLLIDTAVKRVPENKRGMLPPNETVALGLLQKRGVLDDPRLLELVQELGGMRNAVAHSGHVPSPGEAIVYVHTAEAATNRILMWTDELDRTG